MNNFCHSYLDPGYNKEWQQEIPENKYVSLLPITLLHFLSLSPLIEHVNYIVDLQYFVKTVICVMLCLLIIIYFDIIYQSRAVTISFHLKRVLWFFNFPKGKSESKDFHFT